jgi:DNA-binding NarL/FixJ family response regulator
VRGAGADDARGRGIARRGAARGGRSATSSRAPSATTSRGRSTRSARGQAFLGAEVAGRARARLGGDRPSEPFAELTEREREILTLVVRGLTNAAIAERLVLSQKTVRNHVSNVMTKIGARDRAAAVAMARDAGL